MANTTKSKEYYSNLKKRTVLVLKSVQGKDVKNDIEDIENEMFKAFKPEKYQGTKGMEVIHVKGFNDTCLIIGQLHQLQL